MIKTALLYIIGASTFVGVMSQLRKKYQIVNGIGLIPTLSFVMLVSLLAAIVGSFFADGLRFELHSFLFATGFAFLSTVTAALCICGSAFGNLSVLIMYASLGTLTIPSVYGLMVLPEENVLTVGKGCGFVAAFLCLLLNFVKYKKDDVNKVCTKSSIIFKLMCVVVFFTNGSALVVYNLENRYCSDYSYYCFVTEYMLISVVMVAIVLGILLIRNCGKFLEEIKPVARVKNLGIIFLYAILYFASDLLSLNCAGMIPLIIQAPVSFCLPIIVVAIMDYVLYREKLTKRNVLQVVLAFVCCICFVIE